MDIKKILKDEKSIFIFSFLWGLGLAVIVMRKCMDGYCIVVHGPEKNDIENKIFKVSDKCYTFDTEVSKCKSKKEDNILVK